MPVPGMNCCATSRICTVPASFLQSWRLNTHPFAVPFQNFCSAREVTSVIIGYFSIAFVTSRTYAGINIGVLYIPDAAGRIQEFALRGVPSPSLLLSLSSPLPPVLFSSPHFYIYLYSSNNMIAKQIEKKKKK